MTRVLLDLRIAPRKLALERLSLEGRSLERLAPEGQPTALEGFDRAKRAEKSGFALFHDPVSLRAAARGVDGVFHINPAFAPDEADLAWRWSKPPRWLACGSLGYLN